LSRPLSFPQQSVRLRPPPTTSGTDHTTIGDAHPWKRIADLVSEILKWDLLNFSLNVGFLFFGFWLTLVLAEQGLGFDSMPKVLFLKRTCLECI
jgi:hypothetical protein